jgi:hypothetical protein
MQQQPFRSVRSAATSSIRMTSYRAIGVLVIAESLMLVGMIRVIAWYNDTPSVLRERHGYCRRKHPANP